MRRKAVESAELEVMERRIIEIPIAMWEQFDAWLGRCASKETPALQRLVTNTPVWEK